MKYILRTLWLIGYIPVFMLTLVCFFIMMFAYQLVRAFYFIKEGNCEGIPFSPDSLAIYIDEKYRKLLKHL